MNGGLTYKDLEDWKADRLRLDFLERDAPEIQGATLRTLNLGIWQVEGGTLREAIDAAIEAEKNG